MKVILLLIGLALLAGCDVNKNEFGEGFTSELQPRDMVFLDCDEYGLVFDRANDALLEFTMGPTFLDVYEKVKVSGFNVQRVEELVYADLKFHGFAKEWRYGESDIDNPNVWRTKNFPRLRDGYSPDIGAGLQLRRDSLVFTQFSSKESNTSYQCNLVRSWPVLFHTATEKNREWNDSIDAESQAREAEKKAAAERNKI